MLPAPLYPILDPHMSNPQHSQDVELQDDELEQIVAEEERTLARVLKHLATRKLRSRSGLDYDTELLTLRDQIGEARLEDVPALVAQMERLQQVAARRADVVEGHIDSRSPYFGRIVLLEGERKREVLIGKATYLDSKTGVQIVDWRDAPVSRVYYRYEEGDDYDEVFGGRPVEGEVLVRRSLAISESLLRRIGSPQGTFMRRSSGAWVRAGSSATQLQGGQGSAPRSAHYAPVGKLGIEYDGAGRESKFLPEIAALIDQRQFELITKPDSGVVVIQGGAGSGKTTIGLHRMAYLAFQVPTRFRPDRMQVIVFNDALARYISHVLPALGVSGVPVTTYHAWARKLRATQLPKLPRNYTDETPDVVVRLKKHPAWLKIIDDRVEGIASTFAERIRRAMAKEPSLNAVLKMLRKARRKPLVPRIKQVARFVADSNNRVGVAARHAVEREVALLTERAEPLSLWAELLTDRERLQALFEQHAPGEFTAGQMGQVVRWCSTQCNALISTLEDPDGESQQDLDEDRRQGVDGQEEAAAVALDWEDDALFLRMWQRMRGPLRRNKEPLQYEHMFVDEAQDLSPLEMAVLFEAVRGQSLTLAGDVAQRLYNDNGFSDWDGVLDHLGLSHVQVEPLRVSYRSTLEIMDFANGVLGHLLPENAGQATRQGVPVELFKFSHTGDAVGFLSEALRALAGGEPLASVAVITRTPEQAVEYAEGLRRAEVPNVRLIADQDFPFRAGVDVTDVKQVKGLEFDYVVLAEVTQASYPNTDEARHLLHIAATRAAHQLWVLTGERPSPLLPAALVERGY